MSNLPAKPEPGEISSRSPSQDGRRYTRRLAPMANQHPYPHQRREEPPRRDDVYIAPSPRRPPPTFLDTYVAPPPAYDRREDERYQREYAEWERKYGREYYEHQGSAARRHRGNDRRTWDREDSARSWDTRPEHSGRGRGNSRHRGYDRNPRARDSGRGRGFRSRASGSPSRPS